MLTASMRSSGDARSQRAALFALVTVCLAAGCTPGCRRDAVLVPPQHSVRFSVLLPLHPAWEQLRRMEAQIKKTPSRPVELRFTPAALAVPFTPPRGLPLSRVADHEKVVHEDAARYIAQLEASLAVRNRELTDAERHAALQFARTEYNSSLEKRVNELRDAAVANAKVLEQQLEQLNYRLEALASQSRTYTTVGPNARRMLDDVKLQQAEVDRRAQLKNTEITGVLHGDFKGLARESLKNYRGQLDAEAAKRVADFQSKQLRADEQEIAEAQTRVDSQPTPISPLLDRSGEISNSGAAALVQGVEAPNTSVFASSTSDVSKAEQGRRQALQRDIDRLRAMIEEDTRKAVDQIARSERWTVAIHRTGDDWTERVATQLRSQWNNSTSR